MMGFRGEGGGERLLRQGRASIVRRLIVLAAVLPLAASCYVPSDFLAELRIAANGDYALTYKGRVTWAPLYRDVKNGLLTPEEIKAKEDAVYRDMARDGAFTKVEAVGAGIFDVAYERSGRFVGPRAVSFPRRGIEILYLELRSSGHLYVAAAPKLGREQLGELEQLGLKPNGRFRVLTNAVVAGHNAPSSPQALKGYEGWMVYDWVMTGQEKSFPQMAIVLEASSPDPASGQSK